MHKALAGGESIEFLNEEAGRTMVATRHGFVVEVQTLVVMLDRSRTPRSNVKLTLNQLLNLIYLVL